jgi:uncharacterized membrane protein YfcA
MLGVGGGVIVVPALLFLYDREGIPADFAVLSAIGTSLAAICFTSASSALAHHRRKAVDWRLVGLIAPGVVAGSFLGAFVAAALPTTLLRVVFVVFLVIVCLRMLKAEAKGTVERQVRRAGTPELIATGSGIGILSALVGIGGGSLTVPYLLALGIKMHRAVGTSAAIGFPIAVAGAAGYALQHGNAGTRAYAIGFIYLPALAGIAIPSTLFAPLGARLAHALPVGRLRRAFAIFLLIVAGKLAVDAGRRLWHEPTVPSSATAVSGAGNCRHECHRGSSACFAMGTPAAGWAALPERQDQLVPIANDHQLPARAVRQSLLQLLEGG